MPIKTIAFTGPHGTGKTSLFNALTKYFIFEKLGLKVIEEVARELSDRRQIIPENMTPDEFADFQLAIAQEQVRQEQANKLFASDRSLYDFLAYSEMITTPAKADVLQYLEDQLHPYDVIFYVPICFPLTVNPIRQKVDPKFQRQIDVRLRQIYQARKINFVELEGKTTKERANEVCRSLKIDYPFFDCL